MVENNVVEKIVDGARRCRMRISKGDFGTLKMDKKEGSSNYFMPDDLLEIICILERGEKHNRYKIIHKRNFFFSLPNFPPRMENRRH